MKRADLGVAELLIDDFLAVWARKVDLWNDPRPVEQKSVNTYGWWGMERIAN